MYYKVDTPKIYFGQTLTIKCSISSAYNDIRNSLFWNSFYKAYYYLSFRRNSSLVLYRIAA